MRLFARTLPRGLIVLVVLLGTISTSLGTAQAADDQGPGEPPVSPRVTALGLTGPTGSYVGTATTLRATLNDGVDPVVGAVVLVERQGPDGVWDRLASLTTDVEGRVTFDAPTPLGNAVYRSVFEGTESLAPSTSEPVSVTGTKAPTSLRLTGPGTVVDEQSTTLTVVWRTVDARAVSGTVTVQMRVDGTRTWRDIRTLTVRDGRATFPVAPRVDTHWRVVGKTGPTHLGSMSSVKFVDNLPPGLVVALPAAAPTPRPQRTQGRAVGDGLNATATRIPDQVWSTMVGRSWHRGCPVGRSSLRLIRLNYWGFDGYRHRGELVVNAAIVTKTVSAFRRLYRGRFPIRSMYRVDRFGWSDRVNGGNDYASMAADNTSAFNCRDVVGRPGVRSPHSYGRSVDINPWENPYASAADGWVPNTWWVGRSHPLVAWRSTSHGVVRALAAAGFRWTYGVRDAHHFDG